MDTPNTTIRRRIIEFMDKNGLSINNFSVQLGLPQPTVHRQIKGDSSVSSDLIYAILHRFNTLSAEWLLRGVGNMVKDENVPYEGGNSAFSGKKFSDDDDPEVILQMRLKKEKRDAVMNLIFGDNNYEIKQK